MGKQYSDEELLAYKDKPISAVHQRFADWLIDKLEIEFKPAKDANAAEALFRETVRVATVLRSIYQASPENQAARAEAAEEREEAAATKATKAAKATAKAETPAPAKGKATKATKAAKATPPPADDDEDEADTAAATPARKSAPKRAARSGNAAAPF